MIRSLCILLLFCLVSFPIIEIKAQTGSISGIVYDQNLDTPLDAVVVYLEKDNFSAFKVTSMDGRFSFANLNFGDYTLFFSHLGYSNDTIAVSITPENKINTISKILQTESKSLREVKVVADRFKSTVETPMSIRTLTSDAITTNPGSGSDISKVMQILPGVATTSSFRNDLIIRGGSPAENSFYLDGIRIPTINHLTTQGASGGAISLLNADFIRSADLISGNFSAQHSNALSSVFNFNLIDGDSEQKHYRVSAGATNLSLDSYGPLGENLSYIGSIRRSYRQHILKLIGLAVYPVYNDFLLKFTYKPRLNHEISVLGIGAVDQFRVNEDINDSEIQAFLVDNLPVNDQWNYTVGINNKMFTKNGLWSVIASRSHLFNKATRELERGGQQETSLRYASNEINNRISTEYVYSPGWASFRIGAELTQRKSNFDVFNLSFNSQGPLRTEYNTSIDYLMYGAHIQFSTFLVPDRWNITFGLRIDGSDFASQLQNPNKQSSPRISSSIFISDKLSLKGSFGTYYQLPGDVSLGYAENGQLVNQDIVKYIKSTQYVAGISYAFPWSARLTSEVFLKDYSQYPFNTRENISQANEGGEYGVSGNSPIQSIGNGRSKGVEVIYEQNAFKNWFGTLSYTYSLSEFEDYRGVLTASSWDARHILNFVIGKKLARNWQMGMNLRYQSALPYTPFDTYNSSLVPAWDINREGIRNFAFINQERGKSTLLVDLRVDKRWDYKWGSFTFYMDLENILADADSQQVLVLDKSDASGNKVEKPVILNPNAPPASQRYKLKEIQNAEGVLIPTFGFIVEF